MWCPDETSGGLFIETTGQCVARQPGKTIEANATRAGLVSDPRAGRVLASRLAACHAGCGALGEVMTKPPRTRPGPSASAAKDGRRILPPTRYRHPGDVIRLIIAGLVLAAALAATLAADDADCSV